MANIKAGSMALEIAHACRTAFGLLLGGKIMILERQAERDVIQGGELKAIFRVRACTTASTEYTIEACKCIIIEVQFPVNHLLFCCKFDIGRRV
jgi:hypothetical protein